MVRGCAERLPSQLPIYTLSMYTLLALTGSIPKGFCGNQVIRCYTLSKDDAMVRGRWRKMIRMVDEQ